MQVSPQKKSFDKKYPTASDLAKRCAAVAAGAVTATTLMGFVYNSDIPVDLGLRVNPHQLSEVFTDNALIGVNASGSRKLHCQVISMDVTSDFIGFIKEGELRGFDLTYVKIPFLKSKNLSESSELYNMIKEDYQIFDLKDGGIVILPKESQHYYVLGDSPDKYFYTATLRDKHGGVVNWSGSAMSTYDFEEVEPLL